MRRSALAAAVLIAAVAAGGTAAVEGWRTFEGSWSAAGRRETLATGGDRPASIMRISGTVVLSRGACLSRGFQGEAIGFDDGGSISRGRAVWTDERGDRIFSALEGEALETGRRVVGRFTGGTGRYTGVTGEFTLTWQYVVRDGDASIQGRTADLKGRCRLPSDSP